MTIAEERAAARADHGRLWRWICIEVVHGRLPAGATPDTLTDTDRARYQEENP